MKTILRSSILIFLVLTASCMRYLTHERPKVIIPGVDIDQTLKVAEHELRHGGWGSILTMWAIRDQYLTPAQAERASTLYFAYIDSQRVKFNQWHFTWAISNMYRQGDEKTRSALSSAYADATARAEKLGGLANKHVNGPELWMGDAHGGGRLYAHKHVVVPGNPRYVQSYEEFIKKQGRH